MLYAHSGNECANPSCHTKLVYIEDNAKDDQICHIEAASPDGPRYNPNQTDDERSGYDNLILLCHKCHDMIDNNPETYTVELLKKWKKEHESKYKTDNKEKVFRTPIPDGLLPRDNEVDKLFDGISNNRIYNLIGVGGSGKSSLAYLMIQKYKDNFNEIAFVVVNSDIKQDIVTQLNRTLKFELKKDLYPEIISHLQENFKSVQPNLLVLDINETASNTDIFVDEVLKDSMFLEGWKFLILSRESVDTRKRISSHNLYNKNDFDFLKQLFLEKAGERYNDFGDFDTLFNVIFYNPLLAEQLGIYLSNEPQTATIDDIKTILYGSTFREEDMQGNSALQHDETIISFLKNLIVYDKMDINERTLLRHFVLWQTDYISYDVIADLLQGVFESDSVLKKVLKKLVNRSIIVTQVNEDKVLCYMLHGLLAFSLREQIDFEKEDWVGYLDNVERIGKYDYSKFIPYVDCIGNSLCGYDILPSHFYILFNYGLRFQQTLKYNYAHFLYERFIVVLTIAIDGIPNHPEWQMDLLEVEMKLSETYHNLAMIQEMYDIEAAKDSYNKSIDILERFFKDKPEYMDEFVLGYSYLASLLSNKFNDFKLAKEYFNKAITICEQITKHDLETIFEVVQSYITYANFLSKKLNDYELAKEYYDKAKNTLSMVPENNSNVQFFLAEIYGAMAFMQYNLNDIESANKNFNQAIAIGEQLTEVDLLFKYTLSTSYNNLAILQCENSGEFESARTNYEKAIEIREQLPKDNPVFQFSLANSYCNFARLQKEHFGDFKSAELNCKKAISIGEQLPKDNSEYQFLLANARHNFAYLQVEYLEDFKSAKLNYEKSIAIRENLPKDNPEYQNSLAKAYYDFARLQKEHFCDYKSAESNFKKAIEIGKLLPQDNPEYQNDLARAYMNLAILQHEQFENYESAKLNYENAVAIGERLPKDNPEFQIILVSAYFNLALLLHEHLGDFESAESIYKNLTLIGEQLPKNNPDYQDVLALAYNNLAFMQMKLKKNADAELNYCSAINIYKQLEKATPNYLINRLNSEEGLAEIYLSNGKAAQAKEILDRIQPLAKQCLAENPNDDWTITVNNDIDELVEKYSEILNKEI